MRIFVVLIYISVVLSHNSISSCFNVPVYSSFCCGAALFLLLWEVEPFSAVFAVSSRAIVKVGAVVLC